MKMAAPAPNYTTTTTHHHHQALNPNAAEFHPSATHLHHPHRHFMLPQPPASPPHPSFLFHHSAFVLSQPPPYNSFHYLNLPRPTAAVTPSPSPPPLPPPPTRQHVSTGATSRHTGTHQREMGVVMRRNLTNTKTTKFSKATSSSVSNTTTQRDDRNNYNFTRRRPSSVSTTSSSSSKAFFMKEKNPPLPVNPDGRETTVMIRNIPNQYTRKMLIQFLDDFCSRENNKTREQEEHPQEVVEFDFVYLPIDFRTKMNKGYAFVNFTSPEAVWKLQQANMEDQTWGFWDSLRKRREIALAKIQGKNALLKHFELSNFACDSEEYLPVCFSPPRDGYAGSSKKREVSQRNIGHHRRQPTTTTSNKPLPLWHGGKKY